MPSMSTIFFLRLRLAEGCERRRPSEGPTYLTPGMKEAELRDLEMLVASVLSAPGEEQQR
jgi:hypothetical protein